jgi:DNA modification methylase
MEYNVFHSNCIEGLETLEIPIQLTVTSPPYYNAKDYVYYKSYQEYLDILKTVFELVYKKTEDGRMCCVNLSNILLQRENRNSESKRIPIAFHFVPLMESIGWKFLEDILWIKPEGASKNRNGGFFQHRQPIAYKPNVINEYIFVFQKPSKGLIDKIVRNIDPLISENSKVGDDYERTNVWKINPETHIDHPAPFPEELSNRLIRYYSFVGDTVLDPFMGSGTTLLSAYKLNRKSVGFEIHKEYIELFEKRISIVTKDHINTVIKFPIKDFEGLKKEEILKKISKYSKKVLISFCKDKSCKKLTKINIINLLLCENNLIS